jgi:hypothetical protein
MHQLEALLQRSTEFDRKIVRALRRYQFPQDHRSRVVAALLMVSIQHSRSIRELIRIGNDVSALALQRPQFEALVRSFWAELCATPHWVEKAVSPARDAPRIEPAEFPKLSRAIADLATTDHVAEHDVLSHIHRGLRDSANSYAHGGLRAIWFARYPADWETKRLIVGLSNLEAFHAWSRLARLLGAEPSRRIAQALEAFRDCGHLPDTCRTQPAPGDP